MSMTKPAALAVSAPTGRRPAVVRRPLHAKILEVHSETRARIFGALLAEPGRAWRVSQLAALLPDVSVEAVRTTLYLLLGERMVQPVPHNRSLTLRMTNEGQSAIELIRQAWAASDAGEEAREGRVPAAKRTSLTRGEETR